jgi:hypothetical protein
MYEGGKSMKKCIRIFSILLLFVICMIAGSHLFAQEQVKEWSLVGSWINPTYDKTGDFSGKVIYGNDFAISLFHLTSDKTRYGWGHYSVEKDWVEAGAHWFRVEVVFDDGTYYEIDKLTDNGNTYESVFTTGMYPSSFDTSGVQYYYTIRKRQ